MFVFGYFSGILGGWFGDFCDIVDWEWMQWLLGTIRVLFLKENRKNIYVCWQQLVHLNINEYQQNGNS